MSSILKALKRLEHDKAARKPDSFKIDAEILKGGASRRISSMGAFMAAMAIFACGGSAAYLFMKSDSASVSVQTSRAPGTEVKAEPPAITVLPSVPVAIPAVIQTIGQQSTLPKTVRAALADSPGSPQARITRQQAGLVKPVAVAPQAVQAPEPKPVFPSPLPPAATPARPAFKVDGIAFQDGGAESLAMVNGITVSKGSVIEGARVEEIQKDRVRFSRGGEKFDVILDKLN